MKTQGAINLKMGIEGKDVVQTVHVIPKLHEPFILGIDFIRDHGLSYCPKHHTPVRKEFDSDFEGAYGDTSFVPTNMCREGRGRTSTPVGHRHNPDRRYALDSWGPCFDETRRE
jgi:hypothetical protein